MTPRRRFLLATGGVAAGVAVVWGIGRRVLPALPSNSDPGDRDGAFWLQVGASGRVAMLCPIHELGQGSSIALAQIAAEELGVDVESIDLRVASTAELPRMRFTAGSTSIATHARPVARAAAALRETLRARAARLLGVDPSAVRDGRGGFTGPDGRTLAFARLADGAPIVLDAARFPDAPLRSLSNARGHTQVGRPARQWQAREIVTGSPLFAADARWPAMAYGRVAQAPRPGATIVRADATAARAVAGAVAVVDVDGGFAGVVAPTPGRVERALRALAVEWSPPREDVAAAVARAIDVDRRLADGALDHVLEKGPVDTATPWTVDLRVDVPALHHAAQEPRCAIARFVGEPGREVAELRVGTQDAFALRAHAARLLGWPPDRVIVHPVRVGGAFGGRALFDVAREALVLARAAGCPVKVQWTREDEFVADRLRPPSSHRVRVRATPDGRITDWWHAAASGHVLFTELLGPDWLLAPVRALTADFGATRGLVPPYSAIRRRVEFADAALPLHTGPWRSLGATPNAFAIESAVDELARVLRIDPIALRLLNLGPHGARLAACLEKLRERCAARPPAGRPGEGRGVACGVYHDHSFVAVAFDVRVDPGTRRVDVLRAICAQDVGLVVNPDQVRAQVEGCVMQAIGQVTTELAPIGARGPSARRFSDVDLVTIAQAPEFEIDLIGDPAAAPSGVGETALVAAVPALANAIRDACGVRPARLPFAADPAAARPASVPGRGRAPSGPGSHGAGARSHRA